MQLEWVPGLAIVKTNFTDGSYLEWGCKTWAKSSIRNPVVYNFETQEDVVPDIFNTINEFILTLPPEVLSELEILYREMHYDVSNERNITVLNNKLFTSIESIFKFINWNVLYAWADNGKHVNLSLGLKDELTDKDHVAITYFTKDYKELAIFSIMLKLIMPVWGEYYEWVKAVVGVEFTLIYSVEIIKNEFVAENPAFLKLEAYIRHMVKTKLTNTGFSVTSDIGADEIDEYLLAVALWKKVVIFDTREYNRSIIKHIFNLINDRCTRLSFTGPRQKELTDPHGEEVSLVDIVKLSERIPPMVSVAADYYIAHTFLSHLDSFITMEEINELRKTKYIGYIQLNHFIISIMCSPLLGTRTVDLIDSTSFTTCILACYLVLKRLGLNTLAEMLVTKPTPVNLFSLSLSSNKSQIPIDAIKLNKIKGFYTVTGISPFMKRLESLILEVNNYRWDLKEGGIEQLSNEIADLMILTSSGDYLNNIKKYTD